MSFTEREPYKCFVCGKTGVKLWSNCHAEEFLCAECAEKHQAPMYDDGFGAFGNPKNGRLLPKWTIDEDGTVPSGFSRGEKSTLFCVDLRDVSIFGESGCTSYLPACSIEQDADGSWFYVHGETSPEGFSRWESLPLRLPVL